ncbi:putative AP2 domain transcription factor AP2IX-8 [Toxoplasma gondii MAS]|uniref:Putative AP2 domain transcription factor AP2IX-8 n=1 Tax=Toxoplasma gondii MAS TaxID=943118 RepID=A0A086Q9Y4_TOXGO|nr:putative AP2 domain transcription factor AP2IX-8 [Toxoplasma gondii MAS]
MADGREILKMFTIRKYGFRVAREMAIEWRNRRREKLRVESEQQQMLHLRHKAPAAKGTRDNAGGVAPSPAVPALDPVHAINTAPTPTGANPALQAETRRAASPSFSASTCSSNPSSPPNSSGPHQQNLRHLMVSATGTGFGACDPSGLSSPFMQVNIPCVGGQKMPPETPSASASSLSGYSNPLSSPHLASQSPLFLQAPSGGPAGVVSPLSQFPTGLGPTPQAAPGGSLGTPQGAASAGLSGAGNSASSMVGGSVGLSATASGSGAFLEPPDARSSLPAGYSRSVGGESAIDSGICEAPGALVCPGQQRGSLHSGLPCQLAASPGWKPAVSSNRRGDRRHVDAFRVPAVRSESGDLAVAPGSCARHCAKARGEPRRGWSLWVFSRLLPVSADFPLLFHVVPLSPDVPCGAVASSLDASVHTVAR